MNLLKQCINNLDLIYSKLEATAKDFEINYVYLNTLKLILKDSKLPIKNNEIRAFTVNYNKTLEKLYKVCEKQSKLTNDSNKIHLIFVKQFIDIIKQNIITQFN